MSGIGLMELIVIGLVAFSGIAGLVAVAAFILFFANSKRKK